MLDGARAVAVLTEMLGAQARHLVEVRARDARMIACLVANADERTALLCRELGFEVKLGGSGVFGLLGPDVARLFTGFDEGQRAWLETPCGPRETKVLLLAQGVALLALETNDGKVTIVAR